MDELCLTPAECSQPSGLAFMGAFAGRHGFPSQLTLANFVASPRALLAPPSWSWALGFNK